MGLGLVRAEMRLGPHEQSVIDHVREARYRGKSYGVIASEIGLSRGAVAGIVNRQSIAGPPVPIIQLDRGNQGKTRVPDAVRRLAIASAKESTYRRAAEIWGFHHLTIFRWKAEFAAQTPPQTVEA